MRSFINPVLINLVLILLLAGSLASAQTSVPAKQTAGPASATSASSTASTLPSEATVESFLKQTFGWDSAISWKIASIKPSQVPGLAEVDVILARTEGQQGMRMYVSSDGEHALAGQIDIIPFGAKPFDAAKKKLEKGIKGPSRGPKDAAVTIVEFGDLQCPACKAAQPAIEALIAAEPNVRFVFQNFPLVDLHNWAAKGAAYADCVGEASNDAFWKFIAKTYETQVDINASNADEKLTALADEVGLKGADIAVCSSTPIAQAHVDASVALGKSVNVTGTPTLFINGRVIGSVSSVPLDTLKGLVEFAAKQK